ncbi:lovastatin nonaketide synthase [Paramyrothecium foliicola]|nr:lovastatin nonaketide synthase [Paramyrothecium foliicola]
MSNNKGSEPIAIVGSGCRFPGAANSPSALWKLIKTPRDVCQEITPDRFNTKGHYHVDGTHHGTTNVRHAYLLQEDVRVFDAAFFNISPNEADSIDPQQRLLLETVYEALERGGHSIESLSGSDTAVYVGTMGVDYNDTLLRDLSTIPTYFATGTNRAIISNRVSYFFDWHGPSMTIDTACSSSLIAVHQGVQALRTGDTRVAVACGTQMILGPEVFIFESKMKMLSPTGRSRMWDASADGYARGEGVAAIVLKRLSDAIADGDHIECVIRETGANQDGYSNGITVPSTEAQAALIRKTYRNAGLDPENNLYDRPQFFEAHGTGTKAGDPKEAAAIAQCFGRPEAETPLYVGSVKTVIGHTEGAAGLAGLLKASGIIQNGFIPPNLLFEQLNPSIEPFYKGLHVPTTIKPWPELPEGVPRRVSVNSFGFGGSNAHAILEQYVPADKDVKEDEAQPTFTPFIFSAVSEGSLVAQMQAYSEYLKAHPDTNPSSLAWTLQSRRSHFPYKFALPASSIEKLVGAIDDKLASIARAAGTTIGLRSNLKVAAPRVLGVFTGQGAQWPAMGAELIRSSAFVRTRIQHLEDALSSLPAADRPEWRIKDEMLAGAEKSRITEAALSQPLCTAVQIVLVDLLKAAGIKFSAVVGHSSGEIGAAYAAGFLSDRDAIRVAYYRGVFARLAGNAKRGQKGSMLAVGTSWEDAEELINLRAFKGRIAIAAHNSAASVTLSGDADAIVHAKKVFDEEKKFARLLKVDTAYHSHHMLPCSDPYIAALKACGVKANTDRDTSCSWFSSVKPSEEAVEASEELGALYWRDNMVNAVLFADAVKNAVASDPGLTYALEVGPHPALKGPATQNVADVRPTPLPYSGVLSRGKNDVEALSESLGFVWTYLGAQGVDFRAYENLASGITAQPKLMVDLPSYQWNHNRTHWLESRRSRKIRGRSQVFHELLGTPCPDSTERDRRWNNVLKVSEIPWLEGHQLQGQCVFPAAGYVAMALEAAKMLAAEQPVQVIELLDLNIPRAITFEDDSNAGVETLVTLTAIQSSKRPGGTTVAEFSCYSCPSNGTDQEMELMAGARIKIVYGESSINALSSKPLITASMADVDVDHFYASLGKLGYGYAGPFRTMSSTKRRLNQASVQVLSHHYADDDATTYLVHPTWLDVAFQASMLAYSAPGDERLWSLHVPTSIRSIRINPELCAALPLSSIPIPVSAVLADSDVFSASIDLFTEDGEQALVQVEDLTIKPFAPATEADDRRLFSHTKMDVASPDGASVAAGVRPTTDEAEIGVACERISYYYVRSWKKEISDEEWTKGQPHHLALRDYVDNVLEMAANGTHPYIRGDWAADTREDIMALIGRYADNVDIRLISAVGENIPAAVRGETTILEHMLPNNLLDDFYKQGLGFARYNDFLAGMMQQIVHRYPHCRILEIGAGTGGATKAVLGSIGQKFSSYTYTDVSIGFFEKASQLFKEFKDKMTFKTLDIEKSPASQGYEAGSYDIIIASNVLHATAVLEETLKNTRQLLKPGGYLMLLEITNNGSIRFSNIMGGLSGWWLGVDDGRKYAPTITPGEWHSVLRKTGFSGVDNITPEIDNLAWPLSIIAAQAVDDSVNFLRRPLARSSKSIYIDSLVILGNDSLESAQLAEDVSEHLGRFCGNITVLNGLPTEAEARTLSPMSTFINLVDLDAPIFKGITAAKMDGLRRLYELAKHILWITHGAMIDNPYHMASITFSRAMSHEAGHISMNHLDVSELSHNLSKSIAEYLLRQCALDEWETPGARQRHQKFLWSKEPEAFLDRGQLKIPRLVDRYEQNARLNSSKRSISNAIPLSSSNVSVALSPSAAAPSVVQDLYPSAAKDGKNLVKVEASSLMALQIASDAYLYLSVGKDGTNTPVIALSATNSRETAAVATVPAPDAAEPAEKVLVAVLNEALAASIIDALPAGSSLVVHGSSEHRLLTAALSRRAADREVRLTVTCNVTSVDETQDPSWIKLDPRAPRHIVRRLLQPVHATHLLDMTTSAATQPSELSVSVAEVLPTGYKTLNATDFARHSSLLPKDGAKTEHIAARLRDAVSSIKTPEDVEELVVDLGQLHETPTLVQPTSAIRWPSDGQVKVNVRPLDAQRLFSRNKTYLLVGLTGQIGRSLCEWMVANGAGYVCLTSRNPKIDPTWLEAFKDSGAVVKVFSLDVTDKKALTAVVDTIKASCPPIAGVANGAMVLHDCLFSNMSVDVMQKVLGPKIDGSNNLEQVFRDQVLDFFVLFSSSACVIGNSGQSNYAAANGYLNTLARQRRRRGLAASTFDIGRVAGIGYVETAGQAVMDQLNRFGLMAISETELRQMFAETIYAGFPSPKDRLAIPEAVVTTGIRTIRDDEEIQGPWFENPRFSHCIIEANNTEADSGSQGKKNTLPVTEQLARATSKENALEILIQCFSARVCVILQLTDGALDPQNSLVELGVDSLVAVEIRSWFLKELKVDIPVLKIVGGASVTEICERALEKLPEDLLGSSAGAAEEPAKPAIVETKPNLVAEIPTPDPAPSSSASDYNSGSESRDNSESTPMTQLSSRSASPDRKDYFSKPTQAQAQAPPAKAFLKSEPISFGQSRFWFLRLLLEDPTTSNVAFYYHVAGNLRIGDLERAVRMVTARHEALRTCFVEHETEADQAYQKVLHNSPVRLQHKKIQSVDEVAVEYAKIQQHVFDLESGELIDLVLLSLSPSSHYFLFNYHHIIMDGVSFQIFIADLEKAYNGQSLGPAPRQFPDFSRAQRHAYENGEMDDELKYWRSVFPAGEQPPVLPLLPMARTAARTTMRNFGVHQVSARLSPELMSRVKSVSKAQRSTPFHFCLAAYKAMLFSFTQAQDLTIGIADANRTDSDVINSIGFFLNLLTLRFRRQPNQSFARAVSEARDVTYAALANSRLPFDVLLKELNVVRSSTHSPFFQAFFDYRQGAQEKHPWGNTQFEFQEVHPGRTAYDLTLDVTVGNSDALIMFRTQKGLYDATAANLILDTYVHFLDILSSNASLTLKDTPLFGKEQLARATEIGRGPALKSDWPATLPHRIDQVSQQNPGKIALVDDSGESLTYADMIKRVEAIAEFLQGSGVGAGSRVLVFQTAASDWVCSMLAIMRLGAIYVPLDLRNPLPRLSAVAVDCEPAAVLVDSTTVQDVPQLNVPEAVTIDVSTVGRQPLAQVDNVASAESPAAILYTSGSTGTPKGIKVTHAGLRNEIEGYTKTWKLGAERVLQQSAFTFNHSSDQIYTGLVNGGTVHIVPSYQRGDPLSITELMKKYSITYTKATPSEYLLWMQFGGENLKHATSWRAAFGGGESMSALVTDQFAALELPQLRVYNSYGPTEISISSTKMELKYRDHDAMSGGRIPCGYSLPNYFTYVVDEQLKPVPAGMPGELCIGGAGVSQGYFKNKELTDKHFLANPFATPEDITNGWTRMYRTGDIGHLREDGAMVFHSRMNGDNQVKIRGLRIELDDIESNILATAGGALREAVVTLREGDPGLLVAHVVFSPNHETADKEAFLANVLSRLPVPQYMVPALAIPLDKLPLTNHSKVDRKAIAAMPLPVRAKSAEVDEVLSATMEQLKQVWEEVLGNKELGLNIGSSTDFFLVGGNSLLVIRLQARIRRMFNVTIPLADLLAANTLGQMAQKVDDSIKVELIDWQQETVPPTIPSFLDNVRGHPVGSQETKTVLVTGATGFLAKRLLPQLIQDPTIGIIHAVAMRDKQSDGPRLPVSDKIVQHTGDLTSSLLGLSEQKFLSLAGSVDVILHMGAARSFWDNYHVLRATNVDATRELIKLATPRKIPIHYMSSIGVMPRGTKDETSAAAYPPPMDSSGGYIATRWASEQILERSSRTLGVPTWIHRFLPSAQSPSPKEVLDEFVSLVDVSNIMPDMAGWEGRMDMTDAVEAAKNLRNALLQPVEGGKAKFTHHESDIVVQVADLRNYLKKQRGNSGFETMPGLQWIGRIKSLGFDYLLTGQDVTVEGSSSEGVKFESRR